LAKNPEMQMPERNECCKKMEHDLKATCDIHAFRKDCPDMLVDYHKSSGSYVLMIHDGGSSGITISYCPWCGTKLN
jgi:hypothetical protein